MENPADPVPAGDPAPLYTLNPRGRFTDRAADYARFRPSYPADAIDSILDGMGEPSSIRAADIGAGTGISARLLADRGARVTAVEPNEAMRSAATPHPNVRWVEADAENTGLDDASVDLIVCAQAFHWFRHDAALPEFARILRPGGRLAVMWNERDERDDFARAYNRIVAAACNNHPAMKRSFDRGVIPSSGLFHSMREVTMPNTQPLDLEGLIGRALSESYVPRSGPASRRLVEQLRELHADHADNRGMIGLRYITTVLRAQRI